MNPTGTEARVCADIAARQAKGTAKYGTTVQDNPLGLIQWLQHAYEECLDQAVYLKRAMELMQGVEAKCAETTLPIPLNPGELEDPHAELRKTWREGQVWEFRSSGSDQWRKVLMDGRMQPAWYTASEYRRHPEDKDAEPAQPADPHAELKAIYQPGMWWRAKRPNECENQWGPWLRDPTNPGWLHRMDYEIHPDDLPKPQPKEDGWITVPDDCMEMPEGLKSGDLIKARYSDGDSKYRGGAQASAWNWRRPVGDYARIIAYRIIKPAD